MDRSRKLEKVAADIGRRVGHGFWKREGRLGALLRGDGASVVGLRCGGGAGFAGTCPLPRGWRCGMKRRLQCGRSFCSAGFSWKNGQNDPHVGHSAPRMPNSCSRKSSSPGFGSKFFRQISQKNMAASARRGRLYHKRSARGERRGGRLLRGGGGGR